MYLFCLSNKNLFKSPTTMYLNYIKKDDLDVKDFMRKNLYKEMIFIPQTNNFRQVILKTRMQESTERKT